MNKKCLLIGGAGFIGTKLSACLDKNGYDVTVYDCVAKEQLSKEIAGLQYQCMNYFEEDIPDEVLTKQDMVVLLISSVGPNTSMQNPESCYGRDIIRMIRLLDQMQKCKVNQMIFISSGGTIYGNRDVEAFSEDMATSPINHYGIMKLTQEKILMMYNELYGMKNIIFRLANPYGEGQRLSSGIGAVTAFLENIMNDREIFIYGQGEVVRDYIYIDDAVEMMRLLLESDKRKDLSPIYNIGTGQGNSIMQIVAIIEKVIGKKAKIEYKEARKIDVKRNVLDTSKIMAAIGDYPCKQLEEGVREYYNIKKGC